MPTIDMTTVKQIMHGDKEVIKIEDGLGNTMWQKAAPGPVVDPAQYKFEDITLPKVFEYDTYDQQAITSFCNITTHTTSTSSDATQIIALDTSKTRDQVADAAGYNRKLCFIKTDKLYYNISDPSAVSFYIKAQGTSGSSDRTIYIGGVSYNIAKTGSITTVTVPINTSPIVIENGSGNVDIYELGYTTN